MKKITIVLLIISVLLLAACGSKQYAPPDDDETSDEGKIETETEDASDSFLCPVGKTTIGGTTSDALGVEKFTVNDGQVECEGCHSKIILADGKVGTETWLSKGNTCTKMITPQNNLVAENWQEDGKKCTRQLDTSGNELLKICQ